MSLPDLHGYWKYGDAVVPFRLPLAPVRIVAHAYIPRELLASEISLPPHGQNSLDGQPKPADDRQDTKEHEHIMAENETRVVGSVANRSEAPHEAVQCVAEVLSEDLAREFED